MRANCANANRMPISMPKMNVMTGLYAINELNVDSMKDIIIRLLILSNNFNKI